MVQTMKWFKQSKIMKNMMVKLVVMIIAVLLVGILTVIKFGLSYYQSNAEELAARLLKSNMAQIGNQVNTLYMDMMRLSTVIAGDESLLGILGDQGNPKLITGTYQVKPMEEFEKRDYYLYSRLRERTTFYKSNYMFNYKDMHIAVISGAGYAGVASGEIVTTDLSDINRYYGDLIQTTDFQELLNSDETIKWITPLSITGQEGLYPAGEYITLVRKIHYGYTSKPMALLLIQIHMSALDDMVTADFPADVYLFDDKNNCIFARKADGESPGVVKDIKEIDMISEENHIVHHYPISHFGLQMISTMQSYDNFITQGNRFMRQYILAVMLVLVAIIVLIILMVSKLLAPLRQLVMRIHTGTYGSFHMDESVKTDDVHSIVQGFDGMMRENITLNENILTEQKTKYQLRYHMLKAQINPHFLFNTLNVIKWKAIINQDHEVADMLADLGGLLEASMSRDSEIITIAEEIELLEKYIAIQNVRFQDGYTLEIHCDEEVGKCKIIKLLLQPIVENSIVHGFLEPVDRAVIKVSVKKQEQDIHICVTDNGGGMSRERMEEVLKGINTTTNTFNHIGLSNINQRIKYSYGDQYGIILSSEKGRGTTVTVHFPVLTEE